MMNYPLLASFTCVLCLCGSVFAQSPPEKKSAANLTPTEFERLHKEIRPRAGEALWAEVPWMYDLHKARTKAAAEGKPLCIWRMAGDPTAVC